MKEPILDVENPAKIVVEHIQQQLLDEDDAQSEAFSTILDNFVKAAKVEQDYLELSSEQQKESNKILMEFLRAESERMNEYSWRNLLHSDKMWAVVGNLSGILLILNYEKLHVVSTKAFGMIAKIHI